MAFSFYLSSSFGAVSMFEKSYEIREEPKGYETAHKAMARVTKKVRVDLRVMRDAVKGSHHNGWEILTVVVDEVGRNPNDARSAFDLW